MNKRNVLTLGELYDAQHNYVDAILGSDKRYMTVNGVTFSRSVISIMFSYKNASGLFHADNGVLDNRKYYLLVRHNPFYSNESRYGGTCEPNLEAMANHVIERWKKFTQ